MQIKYHEIMSDILVCVDFTLYADVYQVMCCCTLKSLFVKRRAREVLPEVQWLIFITIERLLEIFVLL